MQIPDKFLDKNTIDQMNIGQYGYTVPWGVFVLPDHSTWIHPKYTFYDSPGGTVSLKIQKLHDGYAIFPSEPDHKWLPGEPCYMTSSEVNMYSCPVVNFGEIKPKEIHWLVKLFQTCLS